MHVERFIAKVCTTIALLSLLAGALLYAPSASADPQPPGKCDCADKGKNDFCNSGTGCDPNNKTENCDSACTCQGAGGNLTCMP